MRAAVLFVLFLPLGCGSSDSSGPGPTDAEVDTAVTSDTGKKDGGDTGPVDTNPGKTPAGKTLCGAGDGTGPGGFTFCDSATQDCCGDTLKCVPRGTCTGLAYECSSAASCTGGMKCCIDPPTSGPPAGKCQTACTTVTLCETKDECAPGEMCTPEPVSNTCKK